jgi:hypothetical protein
MRGMVYRLGMWRARRTPHDRYPSMGVVTNPRDVQASMYDMATSRVFFSDHVSGDDSVGNFSTIPNG